MFLARVSSLLATGRRAALAGRRHFSVEATPSAIADLVQSDPIVIFSKTYCGPSGMTKSLFGQVTDLPTTVVELDTLETGAAIQAVLAEMTGQRTVPNVFVDGQHVGGCDDTYAADASGKLAELLAAAKAKS